MDYLEVSSQIEMTKFDENSTIRHFRACYGNYGGVLSFVPVEEAKEKEREGEKMGRGGGGGVKT